MVFDSDKASGKKTWILLPKLTAVKEAAKLVKSFEEIIHSVINA